ncbi:protein kinase domain-containing protein [Ruania albidiflava]|uniref:protein kinase domain-containing protein n=1 Tax=Ruania albidiflava TaxID=366586 RepID=UPI0012F785BC|nr:protein kinase [Ruania albidiflava]
MSAAITVPGYTVTGVAGIGGHGTVLQGRSETGAEVALRIVPEAPAGLVRRARVAARVRHPAVAPVREVVPLPGDGLAVVTELVPGPTLATLRAARRGLSVAECVQVATELLTALETLHAAGIVHGDIAPANVIVAPEEEETGRLVLVDLVGGAAADRGTRGFRAPELDQGALPSAAADVYSAAQLSLWVAEPGARPEVTELLEALLSTDPQVRPSAHHALQLLDGVTRAGVRLAPAEVLASATLREHAARELTTRARARRRRGRRRHRARPRRWLVRSIAGAAAAAAVLTGLRLHGPGPPTGGPAPAPPSDGVADAVRDLLADRDDALAGADREALGTVTVPGSPLAAADTALLTELTTAGVRLLGYRTEVLEVEVVEAGHDAASVRLHLQQSAHQRTGPEGVTTQVPAQPVQCLDLALTRHGGSTWRAVTATAC